MIVMTSLPLPQQNCKVVIVLGNCIVLKGDICMLTIYTWEFDAN